MNKFRRITLATLAGGVAAGIGFKAFGRPAPRYGPIDPADLDRHVDRMLKHLYVEIDATDAQKQKLDPIVRQAAKDLAPMRENLYAARREAIELLSQERVDPAALEALRKADRARRRSLTPADARGRRRPRCCRSSARSSPPTSPAAMDAGGTADVTGRRQSRLGPAPLVYSSSIVAGALLTWLWPLPFALPAAVPIGSTMVLAAIVLFLLSVRAPRRWYSGAGEPANDEHRPDRAIPFQPQSHLSLVLCLAARNCALDQQPLDGGHADSRGCGGLPRRGSKRGAVP